MPNENNGDAGEPTMRLSDAPRNLAEWLWRLKRYERGIYVREQVDGRWGSVALADLAPERWAHHVARWLEDGALPCRVREPDEIHAAAMHGGGDRDEKERGNGD